MSAAGFRTGFWTRYGVGDVTASEAFVLQRPTNYQATPKRGILYVHGVEAGSNLGSCAQYRLFAERTRLITSLTAAGFVVLSCDLGGVSTWGNSTVISRITDAYTYLLTQNVLPSKVSIFCNSMGMVSSMAWAAANLSKVAAVASVLPICDLTDVWTNNRAGLTASINGAYSGAYSEATYGAAHNPQTMAAAGSYASLPIQLWYGDVDVTAIPATVTTFVSTVNSASCTATSIPGAHAESTVDGVDIDLLLAFFGAY